MATNPINKLMPTRVADYFVCVGPNYKTLVNTLSTQASILQKDLLMNTDKQEHPSPVVDGTPRYQTLSTMEIEDLVIDEMYVEDEQPQMNLSKHDSVSPLSPPPFVRADSIHRQSLSSSAVVSEIQYRFPENDHTDTQFDSNLKMFMFPAGYTLSDIPVSPSTSSFIMTQADGTRIYGICILFHHHLHDVIDQMVKKTTESINNVNPNLSIQQQSELLIEHLGFDPVVSKLFFSCYVPYGIALTSHYPFYSQLSAFLRMTFQTVYSNHLSVTAKHIPHLPYTVPTAPPLDTLAHYYTLMSSPSVPRISNLPSSYMSQYPLECILSNLIFETPLPPQGRSIVINNALYMPLKFARPPPNKLPIRDYSYHWLFSWLSIESIIILFAALNTERKILLISNEVGKLNIAAESLTSLLFPLYWRHIYIPVLPANLTDFICAPMPFLCGIHTSYLPDEFVLDGVIVVNLDENTLTGMNVQIPSLSDARLQSLNRHLRKATGQDLSVPMACKLYDGIGNLYRANKMDIDALNPMFTNDGTSNTTILMDHEIHYEQKHPFFHMNHTHWGPLGPSTIPSNFDQETIMHAFQKFYVKILGDYRLYLEPPSETVVENFDKENFIAKHPDGSPFIYDICDTQMFQCFIDDRYEASKTARNQFDILYFDEYVIRTEDESKPTPFLTDTSQDHNSKSSYTVLSIDASSLKNTWKQNTISSKTIIPAYDFLVEKLGQKLASKIGDVKYHNHQFTHVQSPSNQDIPYYHGWPLSLSKKLLIPHRIVAPLTGAEVQNVRTGNHGIFSLTDLSTMNMRFFADKHLYTQHFHTLRMRSAKHDALFKQAGRYFTRQHTFDEEVHRLLCLLTTSCKTRQVLTTGASIDEPWEFLMSTLNFSANEAGQELAELKTGVLLPLTKCITEFEQQLRLKFADAAALEDQAGKAKTVMEKCKKKYELAKSRYTQLVRKREKNIFQNSSVSLTVTSGAANTNGATTTSTAANNTSMNRLSHTTLANGNSANSLGNTANANNVSTYQLDSSSNGESLFETLSATELHKVLDSHNDMEDASLALDQAEIAFQFILHDYDTRMPTIMNDITELNSRRMESFKISSIKWATTKLTRLQAQISHVEQILESAQKIDVNKDIKTYFEGSDLLLTRIKNMISLDQVPQSPQINTTIQLQIGKFDNEISEINNKDTEKTNLADFIDSDSPIANSASTPENLLDDEEHKQLDEHIPPPEVVSIPPPPPDLEELPPPPPMELSTEDESEQSLPLSPLPKEEEDTYDASLPEEVVSVMTTPATPSISFTNTTRSVTSPTAAITIIDSNAPAGRLTIVPFSIANQGCVAPACRVAALPPSCPNCGVCLQHSCICEYMSAGRRKAEIEMPSDFAPNDSKVCSKVSNISMFYIYPTAPPYQHRDPKPNNIVLFPIALWGDKGFQYGLDCCQILKNSAKEIMIIFEQWAQICDQKGKRLSSIGKVPAPRNIDLVWQKQCLIVARESLRIRGAAYEELASVFIKLQFAVRIVKGELKQAKRRYSDHKLKLEKELAFAKKQVQELQEKSSKLNQVYLESSTKLESCGNTVNAKELERLNDIVNQTRQENLHAEHSRIVSERTYVTLQKKHDISIGRLLSLLEKKEKKFSMEMQRVLWATCDWIYSKLINTMRVLGHAQTVVVNGMNSCDDLLMCINILRPHSKYTVPIMNKTTELNRTNILEAWLYEFKTQPDDLLTYCNQSHDLLKYIATIWEDAAISDDNEVKTLRAKVVIVMKNLPRHPTLVTAFNTLTKLCSDISNYSEECSKIYRSVSKQIAATRLLLKENMRIREKRYFDARRILDFAQQELLKAQKDHNVATENMLNAEDRKKHASQTPATQKRGFLDNFTKSPLEQATVKVDSSRKELEKATIVLKKKTEIRDDAQLQLNVLIQSIIGEIFVDEERRFNDMKVKSGDVYYNQYCHTEVLQKSVDMLLRNTNNINSQDDIKSTLTNYCNDVEQGYTNKHLTSCIKFINDLGNTMVHYARNDACVSKADVLTLALASANTVVGGNNTMLHSAGGIVIPDVVLYDVLNLSSLEPEMVNLLTKTCSSQAAELIGYDGVYKRRVGEKERVLALLQTDDLIGKSSSMTVRRYSYSYINSTSTSASVTPMTGICSISVNEELPISTPSDDDSEDDA